MCLFCFSRCNIPQSGSWSPPWHEARRTAGFAGHRSNRLQKHLQTSSTLLHGWMTEEERGQSKRWIIRKKKKTDMKWLEVLDTQDRSFAKNKGLLHQSKSGLYCPELLLCVRTTYPITAYNYNTVKSKIEPHRVSILILVGCCPKPTTKLVAQSLIMKGSLNFVT